MHNTLKVVNDEIHTIRGKSRSLGDVTRICQYYFPGTRIEDVKTIFMDMYLRRQLNHSICYDINKRVHTKGFGKPNARPIDKAEYIRSFSSIRDEYGWLLFELPKK